MLEYYCYVLYYEQDRLFAERNIQQYRPYRIGYVTEAENSFNRNMLLILISKDDFNGATLRLIARQHVHSLTYRQ